MPHCFFPLPPPHFQALSAFVFSSSNVPTTPASSSLMEKKLSKERTLVKRKPPRFSIFLPINLQTLTFRLMKTFPFKGQPANKIVSMFPVTIPNKKVSLQKLRFPSKGQNEKPPEASLYCWMSRSFHVVRLLYFFSYENSLDPTLPCWINFLSFMNNSFCLCLLPPI